MAQMQGRRELEDAFARFFAHLLHFGSNTFVVCPGARSAAFAVAIAMLEAEGLADVTVCVDERTAGFVALGMARQMAARGVQRGRVVVVCTSGSAVANLHPAALEALHAGVCVSFLTADRPANVRMCGHNQTTDQVGIFGSQVPCFDTNVEHWRGEWLSAAQFVCMDGCGPVHLNVQFCEPLAVPGGEFPLFVRTLLHNMHTQVLEHGQNFAHIPSALVTQTTKSARTCAPVPPAHSTQTAASARTSVPLHSTYNAHPLPPAQRTHTLPKGTNGVVIAGDAGGATLSQARDLAQALGWPLFAEPSSGVRSGNCAILNYARTLQSPLAGDLLRDVEQVVIFGRPTLSKHIHALCAMPNVDVFVVDRAIPLQPQVTEGANASKLAIHADRILPPAGNTPPGHWLTRWKQLSSAVEGHLPYTDTETNSSVNTSAETNSCANPNTETDSSTNTSAKTNSSAAPLRHNTQRLQSFQLTKTQIAECVWKKMQTGDALVLGASTSVRTVNDSTRTEHIANFAVHANRGQGGIDGTIGTALGIKAQQERLGEGDSVVRVLLGDLAFLHDCGSLAQIAAERERKSGKYTPKREMGAKAGKTNRKNISSFIHIIVINDFGGSIFKSLKFLKELDPQIYNRVINTHTPCNIKALAEAHGFQYKNIYNIEHLNKALSRRDTDLIIEVRVDE